MHQTAGGVRRVATLGAVTVVAALAIASSARTATGPDAVVLVSGITTTTPFTTPTAQCSGENPRGETWSVDASRFAAQGYRVYTAPVNYGAGPVHRRPPTRSLSTGTGVASS